MTNFELKTPVVLLIFNRPETTIKVFEQVKKAKPPKLFIVADGARFKEEEEKCQQARSIILDNIDWDCEVFTNFAEKNLGCKVRVSTGLNWVFEQVEEAIILEDDCLPTDSFFSYCQTLLEYYRNNEQIMHISGANFQKGIIRNNYSYYFSKYNLVWGWATWRNAWQKYDMDMNRWVEFKDKNLIKLFSDDIYEQKYWTNLFQSVYSKKLGNNSVWDYRWTFSCWLNQGISITPQFNLIANIGFGENSTHTNRIDDPYANLPTQDIWEIKHPPIIAIDKEADTYLFNTVFEGDKIRENDTFYKNLRWQLAKTKKDILTLFKG